MWIDGSAVYYTNWDTDQPQDTSTSTGCIEMTVYGTWALMDSNACNAKRPFVCKYEECEITPFSPEDELLLPSLALYVNSYVPDSESRIRLVRPGLDRLWRLLLLCKTRYGGLLCVHCHLLKNNVYLFLCIETR